MDASKREWARQKLDNIAKLLQRWEQLELQHHQAAPTVWDEITTATPTARKILEYLDPKLGQEFHPERYLQQGSARSDALRGIAIIDDMDEVAENLSPSAPSLKADQFHPWVWDAARTFWDSSHYRQAVDQAATAITAHTQTKVSRRDLVDRDLMNHVFTDKPKPGQAFLRLPGDHTDKTVISRQQAMRPFAEGCYAGLRNPAAHEHGPDWSDQVALEMLGALSVLARWIDECNVVTHQ